jgi:hypothetical protein
MSLRAPTSNGYDTWTPCSKKVSIPLSRWQLFTDSNCTVLRLYPSVPVNSRSAVRTTTLPVGGGPDGNHQYWSERTRRWASVHILCTDARTSSDLMLHCSVLNAGLSEMDSWLPMPGSVTFPSMPGRGCVLDVSISSIHAERYND